MNTNIPFVKKHNQLIASVSASTGNLITQTNSNEVLSFPVLSNSEAFVLDQIEISPSEYESPTEAILADEINFYDGSGKLMQEAQESFSAYVLGSCIVKNISGTLLDHMLEHDSVPEDPLHMTTVQICDSYEFAMFGADHVEKNDHRRVYEPNDQHIRAVLNDYLGRNILDVYTYNPEEVKFDFKRVDDCTYVVICDYYRDVQDDNRMIQNIVVAEFHS